MLIIKSLIDLHKIECFFLQLNNFVSASGHMIAVIHRIYSNVKLIIVTSLSKQSVESLGKVSASAIFASFHIGIIFSKIRFAKTTRGTLNVRWRQRKNKMKILFALFRFKINKQTTSRHEVIALAIIFCLTNKILSRKRNRDHDRFRHF